MTTTDWIIDLSLIGIVVLQMRARRLTLRSLLLPVGIVGWVGFKYLHGIPTAGNDLQLIVPAVLIGLALGTGAGVLTKVYRGSKGEVISKATITAGVLWVLGTGIRLAFQLYSTHGGGDSIGRFSVNHSIGLDAWVPALILMALAQVLARTAVVGLRGIVADRASGPQRVLSA
ncbi:hypothetical protein ACFU6I_44740 [Streptomyces sp. NPDC057486]|uniref:hypothetical protein n=1 Tax=Streptomyces sp. NPDC057486 TaxID=3346145 RepID=UPI003696C8D1